MKLRGIYTSERKGDPMSDQFANKKHVSNFFTQKACPLKYTGLLVYCYRCYQASYETKPSHRRTAKSTGLKEETVANASDVLRKFGLLNNDYEVVDPCPRMDWFQVTDSLRDRFIDKHFSLWFRNWRCFVRQPGPNNPLTVPSVVLYSLIYNSATNGWKPVHGWSIEYLSSITGITSKTVSSSLDRLEEYGFLSVLDGMRFDLFRLRESQLECFADKQAYSGTASLEPDRIREDYSPASKVLDHKAQARKDLVDFLNMFPISSSDKDRVFKAVSGMPIFPNNWKKVADELVGRILERQSR